MASVPVNYQAIAQSGVAAWQRGDAQAAYTAFDQVAQAGRATPQLWLLLAQAAQAVGDRGACDGALDHVLKDDPRNAYALLMKGEVQTAHGDDRAAASWYGMAISSAALIAKLPPDLPPRLAAAQLRIDAAMLRFERHLVDQIAASGIDAARDVPRLAQAIDIATGKRLRYLQQPTSFFYPGLPAVQFYDAGDFAWVSALEAAAPAMRAEVEAVLRAGDNIAPYVQANSDRPTRGHALLNDPDWSAFYLWQNGALVPENVARCPATVAALEAVPIPFITERSPMALYSVLRAKTHIPPHNGMLNTRLICHIPLIVPDHCRLRVGNETRSVTFGKAMIFNDAIEHEAWNDSDQTRVVLLFEIWRPELGEAERRALGVMYEAINAYPAGSSALSA